MLTHGAYIRAKWEGGGRGEGEGKLALENVKPTDSPIYRPPSEFAVRAFRKTFAALRDRREGRARAWKSDGNRAAQGRIPLPMYAPLASARSDAAFLPSSSPLPSVALFVGGSRTPPTREKRTDGGKTQREGVEEGKSEGEPSGRPAGVRPISLAELFYSPIFGSGACCELRNGGGVLVGRGSRVHSTGRWTAGWARATRVSLRKSRKKASDVPATVRRTADIAAPCRVESGGAARACARRAGRAAPHRGREIRTTSLRSI